MTRILAWSLVVAAMVASWWLDPTHLVTGDAALRALRAVVVAVAGLGACAIVGQRVLTRVPVLRDGAAGWAFALGTGLATVATTLSLAGILGLPLTPWLLAGAPVAMALAAAIGAPAPLRWPKASATAWACALTLTFPALVESLAPPTDTDEVYQHLDLARSIVANGSLPGGWLHPDGSRPLPVHVLHAGFFAAGGEAAPRVAHLLLVLALAWAVHALAEARFGPRRGVLPALALLGSASFLREAGMAYNNHIVALLLLLAAEAVLRGEVLAMGALAGAALAAKYTAAPAVTGLFLVAMLPRSDDDAPLRGRAVRATMAGMLALASLLPWWVRNAAEGLHPLFPYAGWPDADGAALRFAWPEKYGVGRTALDFLRLPLDVFFRADPGSFVFIGRLNLAIGVAMVGALAVAVTTGAASRSDTRRLLVVVLVGAAGWAAGPQLLRWLVPLSGVAGLLMGAAAPWRGVWFAWLASLPSNVAPAWQRVPSRIAVVTGREARDAFLERELPAWSTLDALRRMATPDAKVAQLFAWHGYYIEQSHILGSVEDHVPTRWWLARHGDEALRALAREGVTHLIVGDLAFFPKAYPFLAPEELRRQFTQPAEHLRTLLLRDARRLHAEGRWELWALETPNPALDEATKPR